MADFSKSPSITIKESDKIRPNLRFAEDEKSVKLKQEDKRRTKIKREIPQLLTFNELRDFTVPRTGLEPARLAALAPETSASTIPPPGLLRLQRYALFLYFQNIVAVFFG